MRPIVDAARVLSLELRDVASSSTYERLRHAGDNIPELAEVILALPPSIEGDTTSLYLHRLVKPFDIKLTRIAFGLPVGGDLEYADTMTIARALQGRQAV